MIDILITTLIGIAYILAIVGFIGLITVLAVKCLPIIMGLVALLVAYIVGLALTS